jgi:hypothetical protein
MVTVLPTILSFLNVLPLQLTATEGSKKLFSGI